MRAAILAAMDALGVERAHVCGLSLGGVDRASRCDHLAPDALRLADPRRQLSPPTPTARRFTSARSRPAKPARCARLAEARVDVLLAQPADPAVRSEVIETMARIDPAAYRIGAEAVWLADQAERCDERPQPRPWCCAERSTGSPRRRCRRPSPSCIPGARYEPVEGAGHLSNLERPDEFNTLLGAFIRGVDSRP